MWGSNSIPSRFKLSCCEVARFAYDTPPCCTTSKLVPISDYFAQMVSTPTFYARFMIYSLWRMYCGVLARSSPNIFITVKVPSHTLVQSFVPPFQKPFPQLRAIPNIQNTETPVSNVNTDTANSHRYANPGQTAQGLHMRIYARAFVFAEEEAPRYSSPLVHLLFT